MRPTLKKHPFLRVFLVTHVYTFMFDWPPPGQNARNVYHSSRNSSKETITIPGSYLTPDWAANYLECFSQTIMKKYTIQEITHIHTDALLLDLL